MLEYRTKTAFGRWMADCGIETDAEASQMLGLSPIMIRYLREGVSPRGECVPQKDTRLLMTAIFEGMRALKPWPV